MYKSLIFFTINSRKAVSYTHLDKVFDECHKHGMEPLVTLCHYEIPWNLVTKYNGFSDRRAVSYTHLDVYKRQQH